MSPSPKKKPGRPKKIKEEVDLPFKLMLDLGTQLYFGDGESMLEALTNLEKPNKIVSHGLLKVSNKNLKRVLQLTVPQVKRLYYPLARSVVAKQLSYGLK